MLQNEFSEGTFIHMSEQQVELFHRFLKLRDALGWPPRFRLLRNLSRTRKHTRTTYPPGWRFI